MTATGQRQGLAAEGRVAVFVEGRPRTKGSLKPVHRKAGPGRCTVSLTESGEYAIAWKRTMIAALKRGVLAERYPGAVKINCYFRFERLTATDEALPWPTRLSGQWAHGDEDKLRRNVLDALVQSGVILDDSNSVGGDNYKRWCDAGETPGVLIVVRAVGAGEHDTVKALERS